MQHLWIWEGAILVLVVLVEILLSILTKKADDNRIPQYKGLEEYLRSETPPAGGAGGPAAAEAVLAGLDESEAVHDGAPPPASVAA